MKQISNYLYRKYYGKYRILAHLDNNTNDFPRDDKGNVDTDDFYIPCAKGAMIYHYGHNILATFIPSLIKGRNLVKLCDENNIKISHIIEGDGELSFRFNAKDIDFIANYLKAKTSGKDVRPLSIKNLPKSNYNIPYENMQEYKQITGQLSKEDILIISKVTNCFLYEIMQKKYKDIDIKKDIKKKMMARQIKEYIHSMGEWNNYLDYLQREILHYMEEKQNGLL